jgi:hypothetical protein
MPPRRRNALHTSLAVSRPLSDSGSGHYCPGQTGRQNPDLRSQELGKILTKFIKLNIH